MSEIFISFIHEDEFVATAVSDFLKEVLAGSHIDVFMSSDQWKIYAGEKWLDRIITELGGAKVVILLLSKASVERPWVNFEAGGAWLTSKVIIPACFGGISKGNLPKPYSSIQALDLDSYDGMYYLISSVCHHLDKFSPPPPPFGLAMVGYDNENMKPYERLKNVIDEYDAGMKAM